MGNAETKRVLDGFSKRPLHSLASVDQCKNDVIDSNRKLHGSIQAKYFFAPCLRFQPKLDSLSLFDQLMTP